MKSQYVGDINDYWKYIILKSLSDTGLRLAVCWMLTPNDERGDGKRISYLTDDKYRELSPLIYDILKDIVSSGSRSVTAIETAGMFPAIYYKQVSDMREYDDIDLIFFDPDNGFQVKSVERGKRGSERYLYWDDASRIYGRGHSLMVYQHFPRVNRPYFIDELTEIVKSRIGVNVVEHLHTGNVDFVFIPQERHREQIESAIDQIKLGE